MPPRVPLHRTASSSSVSSQYSNSNSNSGAGQNGTSHSNTGATYALQGTIPPPQRNAGHLAYDIDGPHSSSTSQPNGSRLRPSPSIHTPSSSSLKSNYHTQANHQAFSSPPRRNINADVDADDAQGGQPRSFEYRKNYEDDSELLPTHSPVASPAARYRSHTNDSNGYGPAFSSTSPKAAGPSSRLLASDRKSVV